MTDIKDIAEDLGRLDQSVTRLIKERRLSLYQLLCIQLITTGQFNEAQKYLDELQKMTGE